MRTCNYLSLGDFGICFFTYLLLAKLRPNRPKTNQKCQRYATFVIVNMQVRIFEKKDEKQRKPDKNEHEIGKCQKPEPGKSKSQSQSSNCQSQPFNNQKRQKMALGITLEKLQFWSLSFEDLHN